MKKVGGLFTRSALALMALAALPLGAAELTHRWSFNGDWALRYVLPEGGRRIGFAGLTPLVG